MTENKNTVMKFIDGFNKADNAQILACLTDDIVWVLPGLFHLEGKVAFDTEIGNEAFVGNPKITITRLVEEDNVVVAEGSVSVSRREGGMLDQLFCDVCVMENAKIKHLTSFLAGLK